MRAAVPFLLVTGIGLVPMLAQEGTKPAPVLSIGREAVKEGRSAAHEKVEAEWSALFRRANAPGNYYALETMSGPGEVWFVEPLPSFAANEEYEKVFDKEPLKSAVGAMDARDGELRASSRSVWAVYRPELSYKPESFNVAKTRYVSVGTYHVKLGKEADFVNDAKAYFGGYARGNVNLCILAYEVTVGAPAGTYMFFNMMDSMKVLDGEPERAKAVREGMGPDNFDRLMKSAGDIFTSIEDNLFEMKPGMSYPAKSVVDADPAFWNPKPVAKPPAAAPPAAAPPPAAKKSGQ